VRLAGGARVYTISKDVAFREVDGSILLVNLKSGSYYSLNATATFVFRLLSRQKDVAEILSEMRAFYDVPEETARLDLDACLEGLVREGLITIDGGQDDAPPRG
jgi:hypothetical protein